MAAVLINSFWTISTAVKLFSDALHVKASWPTPGPAILRIGPTKDIVKNDVCSIISFWLVYSELFQDKKKIKKKEN